MKLSRRALFTSTPAMLFTATTSPFLFTHAKPNTIKFTSTSRPITDAENNALLHHLRMQVPEEIYQSWFSKLRFETLDGRTVNVTTPDRFIRNWGGFHFIDNVAAACRHVFGEHFDSIGYAERQVVRAKLPTKNLT